MRNGSQKIVIYRRPAASLVTMQTSLGQQPLGRRKWMQIASVGERNSAKMPTKSLRCLAEIDIRAVSYALHLQETNPGCFFHQKILYGIQKIRLSCKFELNDTCLFFYSRYGRTCAGKFEKFTVFKKIHLLCVSLYSSSQHGLIINAYLHG